MSYRAGVGDGLRSLGFAPGPPVIICDGCSARFEVKARGFSGAPAWFIDGRAPPKWSGGRDGDGRRRDLCPDCKDKP